MKKIFFVLAAALAFGAAPTQAASVQCPNAGQVLADPSDYFMLLNVPSGLAASCHDWGGPSNGFPSIVTNNTVTLNNDSVELPVGTSTTALQIDGGAGGAFSGFVSNSTGGTVTFLKNASTPLFLLFKFGGGQTTPHFFTYRLTGVNAGEAVTWTLNQTTVNSPFNGLSGIRLYGNMTTSNTCTNPGGCDPLDPPPVPEPTSIALLGLGLLGAGIARRRK